MAEIDKDEDDSEVCNNCGCVHHAENLLHHGHLLCEDCRKAFDLGVEYTNSQNIARGGTGSGGICTTR